MLRLAVCTLVNGGVYCLLSLHDIFGLKLVCFCGGISDWFCSVCTSKSAVRHSRVAVIEHLFIPNSQAVVCHVKIRQLAHSLLLQFISCL